VGSDAPQATATPTGAVPPTSASTPASPPSTSAGTPPPSSHPGQACPAGLLDGVMTVLNRTLGSGLLSGVLDRVLHALGLSELTWLAAETPHQRAVGVRAAVLGPLRPVAAAAGSPPAVAAACTAALDTRIARTVGR
jgi:hypothetical protein